MIKLLVFLFVSLAVCHQGNKPILTQVTFLYDIKRGSLQSQYTRSFSFYLDNFYKLLQTSSNLIIFGDSFLKQQVWKRRQPINTVFIQKQLATFKDTWYAPKITAVLQKFKKDPQFWNRNSGFPQYGLEYYNIIMMSKTYLMTQALKHDKFSSDYFIWTDGGYMHNFQNNILSPYNTIENYFKFANQPWIYTKYTDPQMFRGYSQTESRYTGKKIASDQMVLANMFGGYIQVVRDVKNTFENLLRMTLEYGDLNSDQSIFSIMLVKFPYLNPLLSAIDMNNVVNRIKWYSISSEKVKYDRQIFASLDKQGNILIKYSRKQSFLSMEVQIVNNTVIKPIFVDRETEIPERPIDKTQKNVLSITNLQIQKMILKQKVILQKQTSIKIFFIFFIVLITYIYAKNEIRKKNQSSQKKPIKQKRFLLEEDHQDLIILMK